VPLREIEADKRASGFTIPMPTIFVVYGSCTNLKLLVTWPPSVVVGETSVTGLNLEEKKSKPTMRNYTVGANLIPSMPKSGRNIKKAESKLDVAIPFPAEDQVRPYTKQFKTESLTIGVLLSL